MENLVSVILQVYLLPRFGKTLPIDFISIVIYVILFLIISINTVEIIYFNSKL